MVQADFYTTDEAKNQEAKNTDTFENTSSSVQENLNNRSNQTVSVEVSAIPEGNNEEPPKYGPYDEVDYINDDFAKRFPDSILPQLK